MTSLTVFVGLLVVVPVLVGIALHVSLLVVDLFEWLVSRIGQ
jgi:uncharacterized membrane protein